MSSLPDIRDAGDLKGKRVFLRVDFNAALVEGEVRDGYRIEQALPTIQYLQKRGAKIILASHIGRDVKESLHPVFSYLKKHLMLSFVEDVLGEKAAAAVSALKDGEVLLLENLRREAGESKNDTAMAKRLASYADIYVNDAFPVSHRGAASIVGVPKLLPHYAGIQFLKEVENLSEAFHPEHPALFLLGGAKFETKSPLIKKFLATYDTVFVGGALANDFFSAKGYEVGRSLTSKETGDIDELLVAENLFLPADVLVERPDGTREEHDPRSVSDDESIFDAGAETAALLSAKIAEAKFILWNGPFGAYEKGFIETTEIIAKAIAASHAVSVVGGGDTIASIAKLNLEKKFTFLSTAGGAMLDFLAEGTLPGIDALRS